MLLSTECDTILRNRWMLIAYGYGDLLICVCILQIKYIKWCKFYMNMNYVLTTPSETFQAEFHQETYL